VYPAREGRNDLALTRFLSRLAHCCTRVEPEEVVENQPGARLRLVNDDLLSCIETCSDAVAEVVCPCIEVTLAVAYGWLAARQVCLYAQFHEDDDKKWACVHPDELLPDRAIQSLTFLLDK